jgi:hypothetical protein
MGVDRNSRDLLFSQTRRVTAWSHSRLSPSGFNGIGQFWLAFSVSGWPSYAANSVNKKAVEQIGIGTLDATRDVIAVVHAREHGATR